MTLKQAQEEGVDSMALVELLINHCEDLFSLQFKTVREFPLSRGDAIAEGKKLPIPVAKPSTPGSDEAVESPPAEPKTGEEDPTDGLSNKERFLKGATRTKEELMALREQSIDGDLRIKTSVGKNTSSPQGVFDEDMTSQSADVVPIVRTKKLTVGANRNSLPDALDHPVQRKSVGLQLASVEDVPEEEGVLEEGEEPDHYAAMQEQSAQQQDEEGGESSDDDSDAEDTSDLNLMSPTATSPPSGRMFDGPTMNRALAKRIEKDLKTKKVFLFGDITMKQGQEIFKKLHKNVDKDSVVDLLLPIDFSVNFEEMKVNRASSLFVHVIWC